MLLRSSVIYGLAVCCTVLGLLALWQRLELAVTNDTYATLTAQTERVRHDLETARLELAAAERRVRLAEDLLATAQPPQPVATADPSQRQQPAEPESVADIARERDAARTEALLLAKDLAAAEAALEDARAAQRQAEDDLAKAQDAARVAATPPQDAAPSPDDDVVTGSVERDPKAQAPAGNATSATEAPPAAEPVLDTAVPAVTPEQTEPAVAAPPPQAAVTPPATPEPSASGAETVAPPVTSVKPDTKTGPAVKSPTASTPARKKSAAAKSVRSKPAQQPKKRRGSEQAGFDYSPF